jgi:ribosomal protein L22
MSAETPPDRKDDAPEPTTGASEGAAAEAKEAPKAPARAPKAAKAKDGAEKPTAAKAAKAKDAAEKPTAAKAAKAKDAAEKPAAGEATGEKATGEKEPTGRKAGAKKADSSKQPSGESAAEKPSVPAAAPRRAAKGAPQAARRRVVRAHARYVRTSARKARMVCGHLRGKSVQEARAILAFTPRGVARDWSKLLESAVANAESNHELLEDDLIVREAYADEGPTIKRFRPRAMGRATPIRKRTSHLTITLTPGPEPRTTKKRG